MFDSWLMVGKFMFSDGESWFLMVSVMVNGPTNGYAQTGSFHDMWSNTVLEKKSFVEISCRIYRYKLYDLIILWYI